MGLVRKQPLGLRGELGLARRVMQFVGTVQREYRSEVRRHLTPLDVGPAICECLEPAPWERSSRFARPFHRRLRLRRPPRPRSGSRNVPKPFERVLHPNRVETSTGSLLVFWPSSSASSFWFPPLPASVRFQRLPR